MSEVARYTEDEIKSLDWKEHIRLRPGMYIGKLGDGTAADDGIYVLVKEIVDNSIDEHVMGNGKKIDITIDDKRVTIRDWGRGIPLGKVVDCVSKINTGGKYDSKAFQKSVGLNGVGTKAVNALSNYFVVQSFRDGRSKRAEFEKGELMVDAPETDTTEPNGTLMVFEPDASIFKNYRYISEFLREQIKNYTYLNSALTIRFNGESYASRRGLLDLLDHKVTEEAALYPVIHVKNEDIELAFTHTDSYGEEYYSFVNGQYTTQGGTHLAAFRETFVKTIREFYKKEFDAADIRASITAAISIRIMEPVFESQTKTKLGSADMGADGPSIKTAMLDFIKKNVDDYLHKNPTVAETSPFINSLLVTPCSSSTPIAWLFMIPQAISSAPKQSVAFVKFKTAPTIPSPKSFIPPTAFEAASIKRPSPPHRPTRLIPRSG